MHISSQPVPVLRRLRAAGNPGGESGQAILESLLCMLVILLIFMGMLQIFQLSTAKLFTDYSATVTARSSAVGFADYLVRRVGQCAAAGASGRIVFPPNLDQGSPLAQYGDERVLIPRYFQGTQWLDYEYWHGDQENIYRTGDSENAPRTTMEAWQSINTNGTTFGNARFNSYPMSMRISIFFPADQDLDITSAALDIDYAGNYLDD